MTEGPSPTQCIGGILADQSSKMAATIIRFIGCLDSVPLVSISDLSS